MSAITQQPGQNTAIPAWVTAQGNIPPGVIESHSGAPPASLLSGTAEPPTSLLAQLSTAFTDGPPAGATGPPRGVSLPTGVTGPPAGFTPPPGVTGPPAGVSIPSGVTGPPAGFSIPSGVTGPPVGMTSFPSGLTGVGSGGLPPQVSSHALTNEQSKALIGVTCMLLVMCMAAVGARVMARRLSRMRLEADDWICVAALAMFIALCIEQFFLAHYGMLMLVQIPPDPKVLHIFGKAEFASQMTYACVTCAAKASLLMLYRRVFSLRVKWFRIAWWTNYGLVGALFIVLIVLNTTQCKPISTIWNSPGSCIPDQTKSAITGFINAAIDSAILVLPLRMVWSLQMSHRQKVAICGVFGLGLIGVAVSLARAVSISSPSLFKSGGLAFILWSTTEPAVALMCNCLPVLRPLYTTSLSKLGSSRGWNWYASKRSRSYGRSRGYSSRNKEKLNLTGSTLHSTLTAKNKKDKSWLQTTDTEMGGGVYEEMQSPISPFDKPLPPAYSPRQEEDTGYHTWTWNLLSRPRDENHAPKLTRSPKARDSAAPWASPYPSSGNRTTVNTGKRKSRKTSPPRIKTHTPILDKSPEPSSQFDNWSSPPRTAKSALSVWKSPIRSPRNDADNWASSSFVPTTQVSDRDMLHQSTPSSPHDSFILPSRPKPVARDESNERAATPKLKIRTQGNNRPLPAPPPKLSSPDTHKEWCREVPPLAGGHPVAQASPRERTNSNETMWPSLAPAVPEITRQEVQAAIYRGHAM